MILWSGATPYNQPRKVVLLCTYPSVASLTCCAAVTALCCPFLIPCNRADSYTLLCIRVLCPEDMRSPKGRLTKEVSRSILFYNSRPVLDN
ncbi:hypothetical protein GGR51DRAFT_505920 [Nemania sp. FL0031]|nr:hypothetical protein GGR51DRAFT_505920 [Nemania sp. FL0031]